MKVTKYNMCSTCVVCGECAVGMSAMHSGRCGTGKCGRGCWLVEWNGLMEMKEHTQLHTITVK